MKNSNIKFIVILLLIFPLTVSFILSCTNFNGESFDKKSEYNEAGLYVPDTIDNREKHQVKKTEYFSYMTVFGLIIIFGSVYVIIRKIKDN